MSILRKKNTEYVQRKMQLNEEEDGDHFEIDVLDDESDEFEEGAL